MSYRKITVLKREYRYSVGPSHTKIRFADKSEVYLNSKIGTPLGSEQYRVAPANIANAIQRLPPPIFTCRDHNFSTHRLTYDPFMVEIKGKRHHMIDCPQCLQRRKEDI